MKLVKKLIISTVVMLVSCGVICPASASMEVPEEKPTFKVVFVGESGVGKTSLLKLMLYGKYYQNEQNTIGAAYYPLKLENFNIAFWDTAGQEKYRALTPQFVRDASVAVIVCDESIKYTNLIAQCSVWLDYIKNYSSDAKIFIVANKAELENREDFYISEIKSFCQNFGYHFLETSVKDNIGISELMSQLEDVCEELGQQEATEETSPIYVSLDGHSKLSRYFSCC